MVMRAQWVVERRQANALVRDIEDLGGTVRARSETDPLPEDLDAFADMEEELLSIVELEIAAPALLDLLGRAVEGQDPRHLLLVDLTQPCLQVRQLPVPAASRLIVKDASGSHAFVRDEAALARRLVRLLLSQEAAPAPPARPGRIEEPGSLRIGRASERMAGHAAGA